MHALVLFWFYLFCFSRGLFLYACWKRFRWYVQNHIYRPKVKQDWGRMILPPVRALYQYLRNEFCGAEPKIISNYFGRLCAMITCTDDALWEYRNNERNKLTLARWSVYIPVAFTRNGRQLAVRVRCCYIRTHCIGCTVSRSRVVVRNRSKPGDVLDCFLRNRAQQVLY
jgi:hypothetical protein